MMHGPLNVKVSGQLHAATTLVSGKELGTHWMKSCLVVRAAVKHTLDEQTISGRVTWAWI